MNLDNINIKPDKISELKAEGLIDSSAIVANPEGIKEIKFMTVITQYPNGVKYIKSWFVGNDRIVPNKKGKNVKKKAKPSFELQHTEEY